MKEAVLVVVTCNNDYFMALCAMVVSLVDHFDPDRDLAIHVISNEISPQDRATIRESLNLRAADLDRIKIYWYGFDSSLLTAMQLPENLHFSLDVYTRLLAPDILPKACERVIYLDCDMIILADVSLIYDSTRNSDKLLHAVHGKFIPWVSSPNGVFDFAARGIPPRTHNFNSGFMIVDLKRWRERKLTVPMIEYLSQNQGAVYFDQGALNAFLYDDWAKLDSRWNQAADVLFYDLWKSAGYSRKEWIRTRDHPYVVHYTGPKKPWLKNHRTPRYSYFYKYLERTVYKNSVKGRPYLESIMGFRIYYYLWKLARLFLLMSA